MPTNFPGGVDSFPSGPTLHTLNTDGTAASPVPTLNHHATQHGNIGDAITAIETYVLSLIPPGTIWAYGGSVAPTGWLLCDGSAVSRTTYANLFAVTGTANGAGDGSTTFNLPDGRDRVLIGTAPGGLGGGRGTQRLLGQTGGEENHALTVAELAAHTHTYNEPSGSASDTPVTVSQATLDVAVAQDGTIIPGIFSGVTTSQTGGGNAHNTMQPFFVGNWIIKT